jgi:hemoglobin
VPGIRYPVPGKLFVMDDIATRADIDHLLRAFYATAMVDPEIGYFFTDVARLDLEAHLPRIGDFWEQVLLQRPVYVGNPMAVHVHLHGASPLTTSHFDRWLRLWAEAVDASFAGKVTEEAKRRAAIIAESMKARLGIGSSVDR